MKQKALKWLAWTIGILTVLSELLSRLPELPG